jgi:RNA recognition motif-containing protein
MREKDEREGEGRKKKGGYAQKIDKISTSFFVTNFPEEVVWGDLWKLFTKYGSVSDVFIPKKVDKWGRRFGFVKFKDVKEVELLSKKLKDVWWNTHKLKINRALFGKGDKKEEDSSALNHPQRAKAVSDLLVSNDLTFKSLFLGKEDAGAAKVDNDGMAVKGDGGRRKIRALNMGDTVPLELHVQEATMKMLRQRWLGFSKRQWTFNPSMID